MNVWQILIKKTNLRFVKIEKVGEFPVFDFLSFRFILVGWNFGKLSIFLHRALGAKNYIVIIAFDGHGIRVRKLERWSVCGSSIGTVSVLTVATDSTIVTFVLHFFSIAEGIVSSAVIDVFSERFLKEGVFAKDALRKDFMLLYSFAALVTFILKLKEFLW